MSQVLPPGPHDEAAALLRAIVETAVDGILTIDESGTIATVNPATERIFGYPSDELIGRNIRMLMPEPYHSQHDSYLNRYMTTGERRIIGIGREVLGRRKDGSVFPLELSVSETRLGDRRIFTGIIRDVSERNRSQLALRRSEARLAGIVGSAMDAIITVDAQQKIILFNAAAEQMFRCPAATAIGGPLDRFIPQRFRPAHAQHIRGFGATGVTSRSMWRPGVLLALRATGEEFPIEATISQIEAEGEKLFTVILRDVTERVRNEEALRAAKNAAEAASRAKDQFMAVMSHELRTPLNAIVGYVDLLLAEVWGSLDANQEKALARVRDSSQHLIAIIEQILLYARSDMGRQVPKPKRFSVAAVLNGVAALVQPALAEKGLAFEVRLPAPAVEIETDAGMVRQIVLNLLSNAIKFTSSGRVELVAEIAGDECQISVVDTGIGIAEHERPLVFDPFWQADQTLTRDIGGTGLGLSIVRRLTDALHGSVDVDSGPGAGTCFTVRLPTTYAAAAHAASRARDDFAPTLG